MSDESQIRVPASFVALHVRPGRSRPDASRAEIAERHDFCEDLATLLTGHARATMLELGVTEDDVLVRCHRGLLADGAGVSAAEAGWVVRRLAELLEWPIPWRLPGEGD
ncbi:MAG: ATPase with chaperone activity [Burkholderiaceae bacterium]